MKEFKNNFNSNLLKWLGIVLFIVFLYNIFGSQTLSSKSISFSDFLDKVESGEVKEVSVRGNLIEGHLSTGNTFSTLCPMSYSRIFDDLRKNNVKIDIVPVESAMGSIIGIFLSWFPALLLVGVWIYFMKNMQGGSKALGFGKSKAKLMKDDGKKILFKDVAGVDEAKEELKEVVDFLKDPEKFNKLGGKIPKGCLLVGTPGTGKTLLAKAVAGEAGVPFFSISGSDFVEMFVGVGASRVRDMFTQAKKHSPCIVFIDEIDAVGRHRGVGLGGGNDEREQTLNQLLVEMDGFSDNQGIIVIAATNRVDVLDKALLRPGRFDRQIIVPMPDIKGREEILKVHAKKIPVAPDVNLRVVARGTPGFSGADLANLVNESALAAARLDRKVVTMQELEHARDKVMMGAERKSMIITDDKKKIVAYHEGGHALVGMMIEGSDPIHKATIIPRGPALGMVTRLPEDDRYLDNRQKIEADLAVAMGGRVAEELIFGKEKITTGASGDFQMATNIARNMVMNWGFSEKIGHISIKNDKENYFGGGGNNNMSEELAKKIDSEIDSILRVAYKKAADILTQNKDALEIIAEGLIRYETLTGDEIKLLLKGEEIRGDEKDLDEGKDFFGKSSVPTNP